MSEEVKQQMGRKLLTAFTLAAFVALIFFTRQQIVDTFFNLKHVQIWVLGFMVVWQILNYHAYTQLYRELFKILGHKTKYWPMYKASVELNFVNHIFPSAGVSGFSYFSLRMKQFGLPVSKSTLVQMMRFVTVFISFQAILLGGVFILAAAGKANNLTILVASSIGTLLIVGTALMVYIVGSKSRIDSFFTKITRILNKIIQIVRPKHPETINISTARKLFLDLHEDYKVIRRNYGALKKPLYYALLANATEIATIYTVYVAFGQLVNPGAVIIAYAVANFAGLISVLPGGIGVYEALTTAVLVAAGVPASIAIPATVMYRVISITIQLPPGYYLYHRALNKSDKPLI